MANTLARDSFRRAGSAIVGDRSDVWASNSFSPNLQHPSVGQRSRVNAWSAIPCLPPMKLGALVNSVFSFG